MSDNEILNQLRNLRRFQRDMISSKLYPVYIENKKEALREVSEQLVAAEEEMNKLYSAWSNLQFKWFSTSAREDAASVYRVSKKNFETLK